MIRLNEKIIEACYYIGGFVGGFIFMEVIADANIFGVGYGMFTGFFIARYEFSRRKGKK